MDPTAIDDKLPTKNKGAHTGVNSKKVKKNNLIIILKITNFGAEAKSKVTLNIDPSYTSHNQE
jgi:hypothetical protein